MSSTRIRSDLSAEAYWSHVRHHGERHPIQIRVIRMVVCGGLACALAILMLPSHVQAESEFIKWQTKNIERNLAIERARVAPLEETIQRQERISERSGHEARNMAVRVNRAYIASQSTDAWMPSESSAFDEAGSRTVEALSDVLQKRARTVLTGSAAKFATSASGVGTVGLAVIEGVDQIGKIVEYRNTAARYRELKRIETMHEANQVGASTFATYRRAELRGVNDRIAALERAQKELRASSGEIESAKGVRIHFDDRILARALHRFGNEATDADFARIQQALYTATSAEQINVAFRTAVNNEKARFIRETKKTVTVRNVVLVSLNAVARAAGGTPNKEVTELGGVTRIYGFVLVPETRDVVLVGRVEPGVPPVGLDNLVTALKAVWKDAVVPTVSLDPDPNSPVAPQRVRVTGIPKNSRFASIMLDADYLMKRIVFGDPSLPLKIKNLKTLSGLFMERGPSDKFARLWLTPEQPEDGEIQISSAEDVVLYETGVRLMTENLKWGGGTALGTGNIDPISEEVVESFTEYYREIEQQMPVYRQLHGLFDLVLLCKIFNQLGVKSPALISITSLPHEPYQVQNSYPAYSLEYTYENEPWELSGGVVVHSYIGRRHQLHYDEEAMASLRKKAVALSHSSRIATRAEGITLTLVVPSGKQRYFAEGMRMQTNGQYTEAELWFTRVIDEDPYFDEAYLQRSLARYNVGKLPEALSDIERSIELLSGDKMLQVMRFALLLEMGQKPSQILMDVSTKLELANLMLEQARLQLEDGDGGASLRSLNLALTFNSKDTDALTFRAFVRLGSGDAEGAFEDASLAIQLEPDFARAYTIRGTVALALGSKDEDFYEDAFEDFTKAIELEPEVPEWWFNRANVYQLWGNRMERDLDLSSGNNAAINRYTKLIEDQPDNAVLYLGRGKKKVEATQIRSGIEDFTMAIRKDSSMALAYVERAGAFHSLEHYQDALADAAKAIQIDSKFARGYATRCAALHKLGRNDTALRDCNAAIRIDPNHGYAYLIRGLIRQATGDRSSAIRDWREAQRVDPAQRGLYQQLIDMAH